MHQPLFYGRFRQGHYTSHCCGTAGLLNHVRWRKKKKRVFFSSICLADERDLIHVLVANTWLLSARSAHRKAKFGWSKLVGTVLVTPENVGWVASTRDYSVPFSDTGKQSVAG